MMSPGRMPVVVLMGCLYVGFCAWRCTAQPNAPTAPPGLSGAVPEDMVIGEWCLAVEETADVLARAQFGSNSVITIKAGAAHPETNVVHKPFDPKKFEEIKAIWVTNLNQPEMKWRIVLKSDHTGEHLVPGLEGKTPGTQAITWDLQGSNLRLKYPEEKRFTEFTARVVSSNEFHYPMQPLGGWFVMRPAKVVAHP